MVLFEKNTRKQILICSFDLLMFISNSTGDLLDNQGPNELGIKAKSVVFEKFLPIIIQ